MGTYAAEQRLLIVIEPDKTSVAAKHAGKALSKIPSTGTIGKVGKAGGVAGAVVSGGIEALYSVGAVVRGKKTAREAAGDIAYASAKGGASGYAGAAAGTMAAGATSAVIVATIGTGLMATVAPAVVGFGAACAAGSFVSDVFDDIFG